MTKNILFSTQDSSLKVFYKVSQIIKKNNQSKNTGFIVTNKQFYKQWINENPEFVSENFSIIKEWELTKVNKFSNVDMNVLESYEKKFGHEPGLFGAIVSDRRLFMGFKNTFTQDYSRRYSDQVLLYILQNCLQKIDEFIKEFKPDIIISFQCVTILDYLIYLFAKHHHIQYLNLRPTRINNRVMFASTINDPPPEIVGLYQKFSHLDHKNDYHKIDTFISETRKDVKFYEGVIEPSLIPGQRISNLKFKKIFSFLKQIFDYFIYKVYLDNHVPNPLIRTFYVGLLNPFKTKIINYYLKPKYISQTDLKNKKYIYFPLHTEPEVSLLVHGKPFINQIELIRMIAISMPIDTILVVKEHPWMIGKRSLKSYKKILNIPRVLIAKPNLYSKELIINASLITVVTGSASLEGVLMQKPVITFGDCMTNILPDFMCARCKDLRELQSLIHKSISAKIDEKWDTYLKTFLLSIFSHSGEINLYTTLLGRKNRYSRSPSNYNQEIESLYKCLDKAINFKFDLFSEDNGAKW